jgi:serine/threonine protein phosphatase PrpC
MNAGAASDTGLLRECNEDRYWMDEQRGQYLVIDGIGGHAAGELAAQTALEEIRESLRGAQGPPEQRVRAAITRANNRIYELAGASQSLSGMACVLTLAIAEDGEITIGHVGDSRLYLVWNGAIRKLTPDHSPVGEEEDAGLLTEEEAMRHPRRNEVFRDVGSQPHAADDPDFIDIRTVPFHPDAAFLLCSDGLTDLLTAEQVRAIVERYTGDAARVAEELVDAADPRSRLRTPVPASSPVLARTHGFSLLRAAARDDSVGGAPHPRLKPWLLLRESALMRLSGSSARAWPMSTSPSTPWPTAPPP